MRDVPTLFRSTRTSIMKVALAFLSLCGVLLSVDAACNAGACSLGSGITGAQGCLNYQTYISCLTVEKSGCTSSSVDQAISVTLAGYITANTVLRNALQCSASGLTMSVVTLLLSLLASFRP